MFSMSGSSGSSKTREEKRREKEQRERKQEILIAKFEQNPCLYDKNNEMFKDSKRKADIIKEIAGILNWKPTEVMISWRNLRDRYNKEKNLKDIDKSGVAAGNRKPWKFYENFKFLETHVRRRSSLYTTQQSDEEDKRAEDTQDTLINNTEMEVTQENTDDTSEIDGSSEYELPGTCVLQDHLFDETRMNGEEAPKKEGGPFVQTGKKVEKMIKEPGKSFSLTSNLKRMSSNEFRIVHLQQEDSCTILCDSLNLALVSMEDKQKQRNWKRKVRSIISDIEDGLGPDDIV